MSPFLICDDLAIGTRRYHYYNIVVVMVRCRHLDGVVDLINPVSSHHSDLAVDVRKTMGIVIIYWNYCFFLVAFA